MEIDGDFPGGNILLEEVQGRTVRLAPDLRDTEGKWFYWYFRVRGAPGRDLRFRFEDDVVGVRGPAVSLDRGLTWCWLGLGSANERGFTYPFPADPPEVRFSFGMPYTQANLDAFLSSRLGNPHLRVDTLCKSGKGRPVECLHVGRVEGEPAHRVLLAARHHACEMMASYALEGLIDAVLADDDRGAWLRNRVEFLILPFADKDGVEDGDQGKMRRPHDHNRDYAAPCLYPEVRALRDLVPRWSEGRLRFALDLHCPWIRGPYNEWIYFVGLPDLEVWGRAQQFAAALESVRAGPLPYRTSNNLPFGQDWNTEAEPPGSEPRTFSGWMAALPEVWFGVTIEIPYANADGAEVNAETARSFGRDLATAIRDHLASGP